MQECELSCFQGFVCLAGACPDICCQSWEVVLEPEILEKYRHVPGALGEQIRQAIVTEKDGAYLELHGGFCAFLDGDHLCRIQRQMGADYLSENCGAYPRFTEIYGGQKERCLALSCPEASRLLLAHSEPLQMELRATPEPPEPNDLDPEQFVLLRSARQTALELIQDRTLPWERRLALLLAFADRLQADLDHGDLARGRDACRTFKDGNSRRGLVKNCPQGGEKRSELLGQIRALFLEMEPLRQCWHEQLLQLKDREPEVPVPDWQREHFMVYYLYRYFLKAVNDGCLAPRVRGGVLSDLLLSQMAERPPVWRLTNFSREVEHSEQNLAHLVAQAGERRFAALEQALY